ncbi:hypothetical protein [Acidithiobacillus sp.]|uniref:hypothetical protein n=1 Tax=Acidithiobacillus sp. TaxID=1872118 RepID=UPI00262A7422|nr:hypothetical protein [Acidithiobacillus sp.]
MLQGIKTTEDPWRSLALAARLQWALSPELPEGYRSFLLTEQWMQTRCYFARRADLRLEEVAVLAEDGDYVIRLCIAKRPDLTAEQVGGFCQDHDPNVRYAIARNPLLTQVQRTQLLADEDELVRQAAAKGPRPSKERCRPGQAPLLC